MKTMLLKNSDTELLKLNENQFRSIFDQHSPNDSKIFSIEHLKFCENTNILHVLNI